MSNQPPRPSLVSRVQKHLVRHATAITQAVESLESLSQSLLTPGKAGRAAHTKPNRFARKAHEPKLVTIDALPVETRNAIQLLDDLTALLKGIQVLYSQLQDVGLQGTLMTLDPSDRKAISQRRQARLCEIRDRLLEARLAGKNYAQLRADSRSMKLLVPSAENGFERLDLGDLLVPLNPTYIQAVFVNLMSYSLETPSQSQFFLDAPLARETTYLNSLVHRVESIRQRLLEPESGSSSLTVGAP
jgi:hypothetical protein